MQLVPEGSSLGVKRSGRETDHSLPSDGIESEWSYTSTHRSPSVPLWHVGIDLPSLTLADNARTCHRKQRPA
jgi:hypothetical protein